MGDRLSSMQGDEPEPRLTRRQKIEVWLLLADEVLAEMDGVGVHGVPPPRKVKGPGDGSGVPVT